jgi:hypothetical protein
MPFTVKFNDTANINKSFYQAMLEGVYIGNVLNLKIANYPLHLIAKNIVKYSFKPQIISTLDKTQVRLIGDYTAIDNKLIKYFQIQIPYIVNHEDDSQTRQYNKYTQFIENLKNFKDIDIFYYDRAEQLGDYHNYFSQLDKKIDELARFNTPEGEVLAKHLRDNLEETIKEMQLKYSSRTREAFLVVSTNVNGNKLSDIDEAKTELDIKVFKQLTSFKELNLSFIEVLGEHRDWLFNNFISNTTNY